MAHVETVIAVGCVAIYYPVLTLPFGSPPIPDNGLQWFRIVFIHLLCTIVCNYFFLHDGVICDPGDIFHKSIRHFGSVIAHYSMHVCHMGVKGHSSSPSPEELVDLLNLLLSSFWPRGQELAMCLLRSNVNNQCVYWTLGNTRC